MAIIETSYTNIFGMLDSVPKGPTKTNFKFKWWYDTNNVEEIIKEEKSPIDITGYFYNDYTLYPQYCAEITLNPNGGSGGEEKRDTDIALKLTSAQLELPSSWVAPASKAFSKWTFTTNADSGEITTGTIFENGNCTIYAQWEDAIMVSFDPNDGYWDSDKSTEPKNFPADKDGKISYAAVESVSRVNEDDAYTYTEDSLFKYTVDTVIYNFVGWYDEKETPLVNINFKEIEEADRKMFASWNSNTIKGDPFTLNGNTYNDIVPGRCNSSKDLPLEINLTLSELQDKEFNVVHDWGETAHIDYVVSTSSDLNATQKFTFSGFSVGTWELRKIIAGEGNTSYTLPNLQGVSLEILDVSSVFDDGTNGNGTWVEDSGAFQYLLNSVANGSGFAITVITNQEEITFIR